MKSRTVETIVSNEEDVRLRIYDGDLPLDEAGAELLRIERAQHAETRRRLREAEAGLANTKGGNASCCAAVAELIRQREEDKQRDRQLADLDAQINQQIMNLTGLP